LQPASYGFLPARFATLTGSTPASTAKRAATTAAAGSLGPGFIDVQGTTVKVLTIQRRNRLFRLLIVRHFHKGEPTRPTRIAIGHQVDSFHCAIPLKQRAELGVGSGKIQIAYKYVFHVRFLPSFNRAGESRQIGISLVQAGLSKGYLTVARSAGPPSCEESHSTQGAQPLPSEFANVLI
jgi:hypothetical protein